ncbi:MAG: tape measure protein [Prevotella sp.]|nr:tape measure protein [Prevotella sp.]
MATLKMDITADNANALRAFNGTAQGVRDMQRQIEQSGGSIEDVFKRLEAAAGGIVGAFTVKEFVSKVAEVRGEFQKLEVAFKTMLGSEQKANALMAQITKTAATTPFDLQGVANAAKQLLAYGTAAEDVNETITRLGDIASGLSVDLGSMVDIYGKVQSVGKMTSRTLLQLQQIGVPITDELAKQFGVVKTEVSSLVTSGKVTADEFNKAIKSMSDEGSMFGGLMEAQSKTIAGQLSNLGDAVDDMFNRIGQQTQGVISEALTDVTKLVENYEQVGRVLLSLVATYGTYKVAVMAVSAAYTAQASGAAALTTAEKLHYVWLCLTQKAQALLNKTMLANPYVLAATALAAVAAALITLNNAQTAQQRAQEKANKAWDDYTKKIDEHRKKINSLISTVQDQSASQLEQAKAYDELSETAPSLTDAYNQQQLAAADLTAVTKKLNDTLDQEQYDELTAKVKAAKEAYDSLVQKYGTQPVYSDTRQEVADALANYNALLAKLREYDKLRQQIAENNKPIEVKIEEAKDNAATCQAILGFYKDAHDAAEKLQDANDKISLDDAAQGLDDFITRAQTDLAGLRKEIEENPMDMRLQLEAGEKQRCLDYLVQMKSDFAERGLTTIPLVFDIDYNSAREAADKAKNVVDNLNNSQTQGKTYKEAYAEAKKAWTDAQAALRAATGGSEADYKKAAENLDEAAKAFKALGGDTTGKKGKTADKLAKETEEYRQAVADAEKERIRAAENAEYATRQAEIDAMKDGNAKTTAQIQLNFEQQKTELDRGYADLINEKIEQARKLWQANPKTKDKAFNPSAVDTSYTEQETAQYEAQMKAIEAQRDKSLEEQQRAELQYMLDYLKEYGSFQQQKLAIAQEYDRKIAEADNEWAKKSLGKEKQGALNQLDMAAVKADIDWTSVFTNFGGLLGTVVEEQLQRLKDYRDTDEFASLDATDKQTLIDAINNLEKRLQPGKLDFKQLGKDIEAYRQAELAYQTAIEDEEKALINLQKAQEDYTNAVKNGNASEIAATQARLDGAQADADIAAENVASAESTRNEMRTTMTNTAKELKDNMDGIVEDLRGLASGSLGTAFTSIINLLGKISPTLKDKLDDLKAIPIIGWIMDILDIFKDGLSSVIGPLIDEMFSAISEILSDVLSGDVLVTIGKSLAGGLGNIFDTLTFGLFGGKESDPTLEKDLERLTASNEALKNSVDVLADKMSDTTTSLTSASDVYATQVKDLTAAQAQTKEEMTRTVQAWYDAGWFHKDKPSSESKIASELGLTSVAANIPALFQENQYIKQINDYLSEKYDKTISSISDLWNLSSEEMYNLSIDLPTIWAKILKGSSEGYKDASEYLEEYIEYWQEFEEIEEAYKEKLTATTFDDLVSDFQSALMDMEHSAEDFGDDVEDILKNAIVSSMMSSLFADKLQEWYDDLATYMENDSGLTKTESDSLRQRYQEIADEAMEARDYLYDILGYTDTSDQTATSASRATISEDTAEEISGRMTALQESNQAIVNNTVIIADMLSSLSAVNNTNAGVFSDIRTLAISSNSYLEDIARYAKLSYNEVSARLGNIQTTLENKL